MIRAREKSRYLDFGPFAACALGVVALFREHEGRKVALSYVVRYGSGPFQFQVGEGPLFLFAIEDEKENLTWEDGEPVAWYGGRKAVAIAPRDSRHRQPPLMPT